MQNPVFEVCEAKELTPQQLAIIASVSSATVTRLIKGESKQINPRILEAFVRLGYNRKVITEQYAQWRQELANQMISDRSCMAF